MENRFFKKLWKTQGILKFGNLSGNYHEISQNNHGISNKYPGKVSFVTQANSLRRTAKDKKMEIEKNDEKIKSAFKY